MYKLTIINGKNRGQAYKLEKDEFTLGRLPECDVCLDSSRVSKRHCKIEISGAQVKVTDLGSSNGTFVNGMLIREKSLVSGDRISVGDFVIEITKINKELQIDNVVPLRGVTLQSATHQSNAIGLTGLQTALNAQGGMAGGMPIGGAMPGMDTGLKVETVPVDLKGKVLYYFEKFIINILYNLNERQQWRSLVAVIICAMIAMTVVLSVSPTVERVTEKLNHEIRDRGLIIARQIVDRNTQAIFEKQETKLDISFAEREKGVISAYLLDLDGRIMAPARKSGQYLTDKFEASFGVKARELFNARDKLEEYGKIYGQSYFVAVPLRVFNNGKNVNVALGIVQYDRSIVLFDESSIAMIYIYAFIFSGIIATFGYFSIIRLTAKPLDQLNLEIDLALKNGSSAIERKYQMEELDPLVDIIGAALQRAGSIKGGGASLESMSTDDVMATIKGVFESNDQTGVFIINQERKLVYMNLAMENMTGVRLAVAVGAELTNASSDSAFSALVEDMANRAAPGHESVVEDFEFSGTMHRVNAAALGAIGSIKYYIITASKSG